MKPRFFALICALLPVLAANISYLISLNADLVPACVPYWQGCTSISRAARSGDAIFLFRPALIIAAVFQFGFWRLVQLWLLELEREATIYHGIMCWLAYIGSFSLIVYADFLGTEGDFYRFMRRYGIVISFAFIPLAQLLLLNRLFRLKASVALLKRNSKILSFQLLCCLAMLLLGIVSVFMDLIGADSYASENIIEWNFMLLISLYYIGSYFLWRWLCLRLI